MLITNRISHTTAFAPSGSRRILDKKSFDRCSEDERIVQTPKAIDFARLRTGIADGTVIGPLRKARLIILKPSERKITFTPLQTAISSEIVVNASKRVRFSADVRSGRRKPPSLSGFSKGNFFTDDRISNRYDAINLIAKLFAKYQSNLFIINSFRTNLNETDQLEWHNLYVKFQLDSHSLSDYEYIKVRHLFFSAVKQPDDEKFFLKKLSNRPIETSLLTEDDDSTTATIENEDNELASRS